MKGWFAFGKQSAEGEPTAPTKTWRVVLTSQEVCEFCDEIFERDAMVFLGSTDDGQAIYACAQDAPPGCVPG